MYGAEPDSQDAYDRDYGLVVRRLCAGGRARFGVKELKFFS